MSNRFISNYITTDMIKSWKPDKPIIISANTGYGKSFFIQNPFRDYLKSHGLKCQYFLPRLRLKEQFTADLPEDDTIRFMTYQALETIMSNPLADVKGCKYIVADECHYFLEDARFNHATDISLDWILGQTNSVRIFMSATSGGLQAYFDEQGIDYDVYQFNSGFEQIQSLNFFWHENQIEKLAKQTITSGKKGVFFIQEAKRAYALHKRFKDQSMFLCSAYNNEYSKYLDTESIQKLLENQSFERNILFCTTVLDVGVTLRDKDLANIVIDVREPSQILQCLGRKRFIDKDDLLNLYIRGRTNNQVGGSLHNIQREINKVQQFLSDPIAYKAAHGRRNDDSGAIYDKFESVGETGEPLFTAKLNKLRYFQMRSDLSEYRMMLNLGEFGFTKYISMLLGKQDNYSILEDAEKKQNLTQYLDGIVDVPILTSSDRNKLIERLDVSHNRRLCKSHKVLAVWLEDSGLPYRLLEYRTNRSINGQRKSLRAWKVVKLE